MSTHRPGTICALASLAFFGVGCAGMEGFARKSDSEPKVVTTEHHPKFDAPTPKKRTPELVTTFGNLRLLSKEYGEAESCFHEAIEKNKKHVPAYLGLAKSHVLRQRYDEALRVLQEVAQIAPKDATIDNELALLHERMGDTESAIAFLGEAIRKDPNSDLYRTNLAGLHAKRGSLDEAFRLYSHVGEPAEAHYRIAAALYQQGQIEASIGRLRTAVSENPDHEQAKYMLDGLMGRNVQTVGYDSRETAPLASSLRMSDNEPTVSVDELPSTIHEAFPFQSNPAPFRNVDSGARDWR